MTSTLYRPGDDGYRLPQRGQYYYQDPTHHGPRSRRSFDGERRSEDTLGYYGRDPKKSSALAPVMIPAPGERHHRDTDSLAESSEYDPEEESKKAKKKYFLCIALMLVLLLLGIILAIVIIWWFFSVTEDPGTRHEVAFNIVFELALPYDEGYAIPSQKKQELEKEFCAAMAVTFAPAYVNCEIFIFGRGNNTVEVDSGIFFDQEQLETMALLSGKTADHMTIKIMLYSMMQSGIKKGEPPLLANGEVHDIDRYVQYEVFAHTEDVYKYEYADTSSDVFKQAAEQYCTAVENTFLREAVRCMVPDILPDFDGNSHKRRKRALEEDHHGVRVKRQEDEVFHTTIRSYVMFDLKPLDDKIHGRGLEPNMEIFLTYIRIFLSEEIEKGNIEILRTGDIRTISKLVIIKSIPFDLYIAFGHEWTNKYLDMATNESTALSVALCSNFTHGFEEHTDIYDSLMKCQVNKFYNLNGNLKAKLRLNFKRYGLENFNKERVVFGQANETIAEAVQNVTLKEDHETILVGLYIEGIVVQLPDEDWRWPSTQYTSLGTSETGK